MHAVLATAMTIATAVPTNAPQGHRAQSPVIVDAKGDVVRFYGVPMNLTPADLKRYRYTVGHFSAEGDTYTFYTLKGENGVEVRVQFDGRRLISARTSSRGAIGPRGVGIGSPLSAVEAAWPEGKADFGIIEHSTYVTFLAAEPGYMPNIYYYFDPEDMPPGAYAGEIWKKTVDLIPRGIKVQTFGIFPREFPEESYDFLTVTSGPCAPRAGVRIGPKQALACKRMTSKRRYRGTWLLDSSRSLFAPAGKPNCLDSQMQETCAELGGKGLDWLRPYSQSHMCPALYRLEFVGRRNVAPNGRPAYRIAVENVIAYEKLPDPPHGDGFCKKPII
jgi:hypothetical protein